MVIFHEALPDGYLLVLAPDAAALAEDELADHLDRACRSGKSAVLVDCRLLETVSATAVWLLWACYRRLHRRRVPLVLCSVSKCVERALRQAFRSTDLCLASSLDEATGLRGFRPGPVSFC